MAIKLRADKGSALTLNELDNNFTSFFYSASLNAAQTQLTFFRSGSASSGISGSSTVNIPLSPYTGSTPPASGNTSTVQYNAGSGNLAGDDDFKWSTSNNAIELGVTSQAGDGISLLNKRLRIKSNAGPNTSAALVLHGNGAKLSGSLSYDPSAVSSTLGSRYDLVLRNETDNATAANANILFYIDKYSSTVPIVGFFRNESKIALRGADKTIEDVNISGSISLQGSGTNVNFLHKIRPFASDSKIPNSVFTGNSRGLAIEGGNQASVVVGIHGQGTSNSANGLYIVSSPATGSSHLPTYNKTIAFFEGNGCVGIGTLLPLSNFTRVTIKGSGQTSSTTALNVRNSNNNNLLNLRDDGQVKLAKGQVTAGVNSEVKIDGNLHVTGSIEVDTLPTASATDYQYLVRNSANKIVQQNIAAPIPLGGIILWSGNMNAIPTGFALCDGTTANSRQTPDLRNKMIVQANNVGAADVPKSTIEGGSPQTTGGDISHTHGGNTGGSSLTIAQLPAHGHQYKDGYFMEINNPGTGNGGTVDGADDVGGGGLRFKGSGKSDTDNRFIYYRNLTTSNTGSGATHNHTIASDNHVNPYYVLAYIMFVGT